MKKVNVAVIGYGHLGKWHCQKAATSPFCNFIGIVEMSEAGRELAKKNHPDVKVVSDWKDFAEMADAFIVVTPTSTHSKLVSELLKAKKHVFCEKPLCSTSDEISMIEKHLDSNLVLQVGHSERCHQIWDKLKPTLENLNKPFILKLNRFAPFKGRAQDVDVISDLMIHDIDLMLYLLKKVPQKVRSFGFKIRTKHHDHVVCHFYFADGSICEITSGRNSTHEVRELELLTAEGATRVDLMNNTFFLASNDQFEDGTYVRSETYQKRDHLQMEQEYFYRSILFKEKIFVNFEDGKKAVKIMDAAEASLHQSKEVEINV